MIHISSDRSNPLVLVVMGSIREGRRCPVIAQWVVSLAEDATNLACEIVDLKGWPLPGTDEPGIPARGGYVQPHTRAWSEKIKASRAVVFVTPQYNWGYPAALKNAIDHLFKEWNGKPAAIVTYGGHGGTKCAAQLRQVLEAVEMRVAETMPAITLTHDMILGGPCDPPKDFTVSADTVRTAMQELAALA